MKNLKPHLEEKIEKNLTPYLNFLNPYKKRGVRKKTKPLIF